MKLKVCGMKMNIEQVAALRPDYLGFIFWKPSKRFFEGTIPSLSLGIKKVGVFVDASIKEVLEKVKKHDLQGIQLHGHESREYCEQLLVKCHAELASPERSRRVEAYSKNVRKVQIIKMFSIKDKFDFSMLTPYEEVCDYYLFDTKGKLPGGNGYTFDWRLLKDYPSTKPYFLSGGIGLDETDSIREFLQRPESRFCHAIDVNSRFEIEPGLKDIEKLKAFKKAL